MSDRTEATANATRWAIAATAAADSWHEGRQGPLTPNVDAFYEACILAREMAAMWATIAALHPVEPVPSLGKRFFLSSTPAGRPHCGCAMWDQGIAHMAHDWYLVGGPRVHCNGAPPDAKVPCGYCGCTDDPAHCTCDHEGTGATADQLPLEGRICTASITPPENLIGGGSTWGCVLTVGHYVDDFDAKDGPHRNLLEPSKSDVALSWTDRAEGAVPHGARPEGSSGAAPS